MQELLCTALTQMEESGGKVEVRDSAIKGDNVPCARKIVFSGVSVSNRLFSNFKKFTT